MYALHFARVVCEIHHRRRAGRYLYILYFDSEIFHFHFPIGIPAYNSAWAYLPSLAVITIPIFVCEPLVLLSNATNYYYAVHTGRLIYFIIIIIISFFSTLWLITYNTEFYCKYRGWFLWGFFFFFLRKIEKCRIPMPSIKISIRKTGCLSTS